MTKVPETIEEAQRRQATILGGEGALGEQPFIIDEPLSANIGEYIKERRAKRVARAKHNMNWK